MCLAEQQSSTYFPPASPKTASKQNCPEDFLVTEVKFLESRVLFDCADLIGSMKGKVKVMGDIKPPRTRVTASNPWGISAIVLWEVAKNSAGSSRECTSGRSISPFAANPRSWTS